MTLTHFQSHFFLGCEDARCYTPVTTCSLNSPAECPRSEGEHRCSMDFLVKIYPQGVLTSKLDQLQIGSNILISEACGTFDSALLEAKDVIAIAAGTGITPMIRVILDTLHRAHRYYLI